MVGGEVVGRAECGCCGMWEECTLEYIGWVRARFGGVWVCGLCEEAIKDERVRLGVGVEVALRRLQMLALPFPKLNPLSNSSRTSCPPLLLHPTRVSLP
ncbi:hypothetical protein OIU84_001933 [Salix udensis]|uniref:DUF1677 family protein n=1 Tax=Salix udensis TaxID=889485 RepID=A0AAD6P6G4_9ROSI|nr:hypothetical protein OIU84_001933 [Salix udensis]